MTLKHTTIISAYGEDLNKGLALLFENYGQALFGYSVRNWRLNEDEGYNVLYKTLESVGKVLNRYEFSSDKHFSNWLFKIHKNNILQLLREKRRKEPHTIPVAFDQWEKEWQDLGTQGEASSDWELTELINYRDVLERISRIEPYTPSPEQNHLMMSMQKALLELNDTDRELLLLRMNDYSYEEIAGMLGMENNQLKVRFNRAKAKLEKLTLTILKEVYNETRK